MDIPTRFDAQRNIIMDVTLIGTCREKKTNLILDTGFSLSLAVPISIACEIGLVPSGVGRVRLADGSVITLPIFLGKIKIGDKIIDTTYLVLSEESRECLIGMELLAPYKISFHAKAKRVTIEESFIKDAHISELKQSLRKIIPR